MPSRGKTSEKDAGKTATPKLTFRQYVGFLDRYLKPQWIAAVLLAAFLISSNAAQIAIPQILRTFIDSAKAGAAVSALIRSGILFVSVAFLQQVISVAATYFGQKVAWTAANALRADVMNHCLSLDMSFYNDHTPGEMIERVDGDVSATGGLFAQFMIQLIGNALLALGILLVLFRENWILGLGLTVYVGLAFVLLNSIKNIAIVHWREMRAQSSEVFGFLEERFAGTEDIRSCSAKPFMLNRFFTLTRAWLKKQIKAAMMTNIIVNSSFILHAVGTSAALGLGVYLFRADVISLGTVYLILHYTNLINIPIQRITSEMEFFQRAMGSFSRILELTGEKSGIIGGKTASLPKGPLTVGFDSVSFAYKDEPVIRDVSFTLEKGKVLGLLGRTGSGKTTLARLLFRLYDPQQGEIKIGGTNVRDLDLAFLRQKISMVTQNVHLFRAAVRDNLTLFNRDIPDEAVLQAIEDLGLGRWFGSLSDGLDTVLSGESGLSAGEAQLLAFTRIFLRKEPGLIILDEASSRLDPVTEQLIESTVARLLSDSSAIIVAHRLKTVLRTDEIMILENGRICEYGDKTALMKDTSSRFHSLLQTGLEEVLA
jgi:ATP-binding cassette subfamily B protein